MRAIVQRVKSASVRVDDNIVGAIDKGYLILLGVSETDEMSDLAYIHKKIVGLRIFTDYQDKMNLSIKDVDGSILLVSQFTLYGDVRRGNRPSFTSAAKPQKAMDYYEKMITMLKESGIGVKTGIFGEHMEVGLVNDGPVTIILDSTKVI